MKRSIFNVLLMMVNIFLLASCKESTEPQTEAPKTSHAVYICNAGASSISVIDLTSGGVANDIVLVGTWPNQLVYHDKHLYCVNSGSNSISVFNTENWEDQQIYSLGDGQNPMNLVVYNDQFLYVTCLLSNRILQVDRGSGSVLKSVAAGVGTTGIAASSGKIYASNTNAVFNGSSVDYGQGSITVLDGDSGNFIRTIMVGMNPQAVSTAPDGTIHVLCTGNYFDVFGKILIVDPHKDQVIDSVAIGGSPGGLDATSPSGMAYVSNWGMGLLSYNTESHTIINGTDNYLLGKGGSGLVSDGDGNVYISVWDENQIVKLNKNGGIISTFNVGLNPQGLAIRID